MNIIVLVLALFLAACAADPMVDCDLDVNHDHVDCLDFSGGDSDGDDG